jgi:hypothetical protein
VSHLAIYFRRSLRIEYFHSICELWKLLSVVCRVIGCPLRQSRICWRLTSDNWPSWKNSSLRWSSLLYDWWDTYLSLFRLLLLCKHDTNHNARVSLLDVLHQGNWTYVTEWSSFQQVALLHSVICVQLKADNSSWKLQLRCGCHFPCCVLALSLLTTGMLVHNYQVSPFAWLGIPICDIFINQFWVHKLCWLL